MTKNELRIAINSMVKVENVKFVRTYGLPFGVGYDLDIEVVVKETGEVKTIQAHANKNSWWAARHLKEDDVKPYTGKLEYRGHISESWINGWAHMAYLRNLKKVELTKMWEDYND